jgi:ADP-ribose pyrophosphatase YjhB (NUDIX family)
LIADDRNRILLCEHTYRKFHPWGLPGGGLEYGESPECAIKREVREETGLDVHVEKLLSAESSKEFHHVSLIYLCRIVGGSFVPNLEISQTRFFDLGDLPDLLHTERRLIERLADQLTS